MATTATLRIRSANASPSAIATTSATATPSAVANKSLAKSTKPKLVQQTFQWDATPQGTGVGTSACVSNGFLSFPKKSKPLAVSKSSTERLGRCEHAGGLMEKVLSRYGISPEEFRLAVEELRASRSMNPCETRRF